jgi:hypothetical protein
MRPTITIESAAAVGRPHRHPHHPRPEETTVKELKIAAGLLTVCANLNLPKPGTANRVGLIALPPTGLGWAELTPAQARELARNLERAADETEAADAMKENDHA